MENHLCPQMTNYTHLSSVMILIIQPIRAALEESKEHYGKTVEGNH